MSDARKALFGDLVFNEAGEPARVVTVGGVPHYAVPDGDFLRHVEAAYVDHQILDQIKERILPMKDAIIEGMIQMMGQEDLFTKAMIDASIQDMDQQMEQLMAYGLPAGVQAWLGMLGFRVVVNVHGEVMEIDAPSAVDEGEW